MNIHESQSNSLGINLMREIEYPYIVQLFRYISMLNSFFSFFSYFHAKVYERNYVRAHISPNGQFY